MRTTQRESVSRGHASPSMQPVCSTAVTRAPCMRSLATPCVESRPMWWLATGVAASLLSCGSVANAASSASFQIPASTFDVAGGSSSSASHQIVSCVGSEIAGTAASSSFRVDSGCGAVLGFAANPIMVQEVALPVPALSVVTTILLTMTLCVFALLQIPRRTRKAPSRIV